MSAEGVEKSKSTFVVTDIVKFGASVASGLVKLAVTEHKTRSQKEVYFLDCEIDGSKNRLYFALPKGSELDNYIDEKPKVILRIPIDEEGHTVSEEMKKFEVDYKDFMVAHVQPLIAAAAKFDKTMYMANFAKPDSSNSKFCLIGLPRDMKSEQITRLIEAKGSSVLLSVSYMYLLKDEEKGRGIYGASFEVGRYPYVDKTGKPPLAPKSSSVGGKRKAKFVDDDDRPSPAFVDPPAEKKIRETQEETLSLEKPVAVESGTIDV